MNKSLSGVRNESKQRHRRARNEARTEPHRDVDGGLHERDYSKIARSVGTTTWGSILVAVASVACVVVLRLLLERHLGERVPYVLFLSAVAITTYLCGARGGAIATALSVLSGSYFFAAPKRTLYVRNAGDVWSAAEFCLAGVIVVLALYLERLARARIVRRDRELLRSMEERTRLERELDESRRLESLGRLAGGIAHDFNNLLTVILGSSELLRAGRSDVDLVDAIETASKRGADITRQLLGLARRQVMKLQPLTLNEIADESKKLLARLIPEDVALEWRLESNPWSFEGDPTQLQQVLINLVTNARDAMPAGGTVRIESANCTLDERYARRHPEVTPGEYSALFVIDNGKGMSEEVRRHAFDPFYTTKGVGEGTGLGLAMVYGIVKQLKGHVSVTSELGTGTTVCVYLPRLQGGLVASSTSFRVAESGHFKLAILLVEDNELVMTTTKHLLEVLGHEVLAAANGAEALEVCRQCPKPIDVLITDVVMPWMNGRELAEHVRRMRPDTKVVYVSGYAENVVLRKGIIRSDVVFLKKPFTRGELEATLSEVMSRNKSAAGG